MEPPGVFAPLKLLFKLSILHSMVACVSSAMRLILWVSGTDYLSEKAGIKKDSRGGGEGYLQWTSIPSRKSSRLPRHFMLSNCNRLQSGYMSCYRKLLCHKIEY